MTGPLADNYFRYIKPEPCKDYKTSRELLVTCMIVNSNPLSLAFDGIRGYDGIQ